MGWFPASTAPPDEAASGGWGQDSGDRTGRGSPRLCPGHTQGFPGDAEPLDELPRNATFGAAWSQLPRGARAALSRRKEPAQDLCPRRSHVRLCKVASPARQGAPRLGQPALPVELIRPRTTAVPPVGSATRSEQGAPKAPITGPRRRTGSLSSSALAALGVHNVSFPYLGAEYKCTEMCLPG